ncbi:hypothetical protein D3C87_1363930 [compost metagenome]
MSSSVFCLISSENASPFILLAYNPASWACFSNAALLYQPGDAVFPAAGAFSKKTPTVAAPDPNALVILEARPNPVEAPITSTFLGPFIAPLDFTYSIWLGTFCSHPFGCAVRHINPRILGSIIIKYFLFGY